MLISQFECQARSSWLTGEAPAWNDPILNKSYEDSRNRLRPGRRKNVAERMGPRRTRDKGERKSQTGSGGKNSIQQ